MKIEQDTVSALARLARLDLNPEEQRAFAEQLPKILEYVGQLQKVKTDIVPGESTPSGGWREDDVMSSAVADDILQQAPDRDDRFWRVPSVF